jgi:tetratricopeptide (TPR) repeat protein
VTVLKAVQIGRILLLSSSEYEFMKIKAISCTLLLVLLAFPGIKIAAQNAPLTYPEILTALNAKLPKGMTRQKLIANLIADIRRRKLDKPLSKDIEVLLRQAGAPNGLIDEIRQNSPRPVIGSITLNINVPGSQITLDKYGIFNHVRDFQIAPGTYRIDITKAGYEPVTLFERVAPGETKVLNVILEPLRLSTKLSLAEEKFKAGSFDEVLRLCNEILAVEPKNARANLLAGLSLLALGRYDGAALDRLFVAVENGEAFRFVLGRRKGFGFLKLDETLEFGYLEVKNDSFSFTNTYAESALSMTNIGFQEFAVPYQKILELKAERYNYSVRLFLKILVPKPGSKKDDKKEFGFYSSKARVERYIREGEKYYSSRIVCYECESEVTFIFELLNRLRLRR